MDEPLLLQDPQMVRGDAILKANGIPDFGEGGSGMLVDGLIDQEAELPLKHLLPSDAGMLERRERCPCCDEDDPAHLDRIDPVKGWAWSSLMPDVEGCALPR